MISKIFNVIFIASVCVFVLTACDNNSHAKAGHKMQQEMQFNNRSFEHSMQEIRGNHSAESMPNEYKNQAAPSEQPRKLVTKEIKKQLNSLETETKQFNESLTNYLSGKSDVLQEPKRNLADELDQIIKQGINKENGKKIQTNELKKRIRDAELRLAMLNKSLVELDK